MRIIYRTNTFEKDFVRMAKRGKSPVKLKRLVEQLVNDEPLPSSRRDHPLSGDYTGTRECHIEPDWLLIYEIDPEELRLIRTGTHSDLFG